VHEERLWRDQLEAHGDGERTPERERGRGSEHEEDADPLVVGREEPRADGGLHVEVVCGAGGSLVRARRGGRAHGRSWGGELCGVAPPAVSVGAVVVRSGPVVVSRPRRSPGDGEIAFMNSMIAPTSAAEIRPW